MIGRSGAAAALGSLLLAGSAWTWAPPGHAAADGGSVRCEGASESSYEPPLTLVPAETRVRTRARYTCTAAPDRTLSATGVLDGTSPQASCLALTGSRLTEDVRYSDGERSFIVYTDSTTVRVLGVLLVRLSGQVAEGRGEGQPAQRTVLALPGRLPTQCLLSGLPGSSGRALLEIGP